MPQRPLHYASNATVAELKLTNKILRAMPGSPRQRELQAKRDQMRKAKPMILTLLRIDKTEHNRQAFDDNRFRVTRVIATYIGEDSFEYGKAFESHHTPIVPESGTHAELNAMKNQYTS